jgi:hypothetical protein
VASTPVFMSSDVGGPRSQSGCLGEEKYLTTAGNRNLDPQLCSLVSVPTTLLAVHVQNMPSAFPPSACQYIMYQVCHAQSLSPSLSSTSLSEKCEQFVF